MAVTEVLRGLGQWDVELDPEKMPEDTWQKLTKFGHISIHVGRPDVRVSGDSLLRSARFTGVMIGQIDGNSSRYIDGFGMAFWLGDSENKGDIRETLLQFTNSPFDDTIRALLPASGSVVEGAIYDIPELWSGGHQYQTPLADIDYVCQTIAEEVAWRVNGDATLDAGYETQIFVTDPKTIVTRKMMNGFDRVSAYDMFNKSISGTSKTSSDMEDFTTRVLLLAQGSDGTISTATKDILPGLNPYKDLHGNTIKITRIIQESDTDPENAEARAQLQLNRFTSAREALSLSTSKYDVKGDIAVGDYLWVCDPLMDLVDTNNEVPHRGKLINPMKLRLTESTWPIVQGHSVMFRTYDGEWIDLTEYVIWESGDTTLVVGGYSRSLTSGGGGVFPVTPPEENSTVPGKTEWDLPWVQSVYQSPLTGESKAEVELKWHQPLNVGGSMMTDGDYYEIRYRTSSTPFFTPTIEELATYTLDELNTVKYPISSGIESEWQFARAPFDTLKFRLQELLPGMTYEAQIRTVDNGRPANVGEWSDAEQWQASRDIYPPATPAAPFIAAGPAMVLMKHNLGRADGGEFNLDRDLGQLVLHGSVDPLFTPEPSTIVGRVQADWGMITGEIPIVASFQITEQEPVYYKVVAVDVSGNESLPSAAAEAMAELWGDRYIQNLIVDKVTAGTISADWIIGAYIRTGKTGARVELSNAGIHGYNASNERLLDWQSSTGKLKVIGRGGIEITDGALRILNAAGKTIVELGECTDGRHGLQVYKDDGGRVARIGELESAGGEGIEFVNDSGNLVRANTMAFGMQGDVIDAVANVTVQSPSWGNYGGPQVTVNIGNTGRALVILSGWVNAADASGLFQTFQATRVSTGTVSYAAGLKQLLTQTSFGENFSNTVSGVFLVEGLAVGDHTFRCWYKRNAYSGSPPPTPSISLRNFVVVPY